MKHIKLTLLIAFLLLVLTGCQFGHQHTWIDATCISPRTCSSCNETEGEPSGHLWKDATCDEPKTCSRCYEIEGAALGHDWLEASCVAPKTCSRCSALEGERTPHTWDVIDRVIACTECGTVNDVVTVKYFTLDGIPLLDEDMADEYLKVSEQNRVQNDATFLAHDGWIYGQAWNSQGESQFIKVRDDGSDWTVLDAGFAHHIYISEGYIYYMLHNGDSSGMYKMKASGAGKQLLGKVNGSMQLVGNYIYYADLNYETENDENGNGTRVKPEYCHLFRCDLDGSNVTEIIAKPTFYFFVFEDGIVYQDDNDNCSLHICELDGSNDKKVNDAFTCWPLYDGEAIYYVKIDETMENEQRSIWKVKPDGSEEELVANCNASHGLLMKDNQLYFIDGKDSNRMYRINKDGTNLTLITQDVNLRYPQLFNNSIKYTKYSADNKYIEGNYFCKYDGGGKWDFLDMKD